MAELIFLAGFLWTLMLVVMKLDKKPPENEAWVWGFGLMILGSLLMAGY